MTDIPSYRPTDCRIHPTICPKPSDHLSVPLWGRTFLCTFAPRNSNVQMSMETTTLIILMAAALVILTIVVGLLVLHLFHKSDELQRKNDVIVREVRRNQELIDRAVQNGVKRAVMLMTIMIPFFTNMTCIDLNLHLTYQSTTTEPSVHSTRYFDDLRLTSQSSVSGSAHFNLKNENL